MHPMQLRNKRRAWQGLVGGIGVVIALGGFVGGYYSIRSTIVATFGVWIVGTLLVNLLTD